MSEMNEELRQALVDLQTGLNRLHASQDRLRVDLMAGLDRLEASINEVAAKVRAWRDGRKDETGEGA